MADAIRSSVWSWVGALAVGMIFTAGIYWFLPLLPWWAYFILFSVAVGSAAKEWRETASSEMIIDADDRPDEGRNGVNIQAHR